MGRQRCIGCERPVSVCLCAQLPSPPLHTRTCVIILQHPHEARHKLSTLPILAKCLANCHVLHGRRFQAGCSPLLDFFFTHDLPAHHALLLFPTPSAQPIGVWFAHHHLQDSCCSCTSMQVGSAYTLAHSLEEAAPKPEELNISSSPCPAVEFGAFGSSTEDSEALSLQLDTSSSIAYDSGSLRQQMGSSSHVCGPLNLSTKPSGGKSSCVTSDTSSHSLQAAGEGNHVPQALDCEFQQEDTSPDLACVDKYTTFDSDHHASVLIDKWHGSTFSSQRGGTSVCSVNNTDVCSDKSSVPHLVLIAVDATWRHANEMIRASAPYLNKFAIPVCLPFDTDQDGVGMANSELIIRKEPFKGCMTTLEAISSCLKVLEPNGAAIHDKLTCVLRSMCMKNLIAVMHGRAINNDISQWKIGGAPGGSVFECEGRPHPLWGGDAAMEHILTWKGKR